MIKVRIRVRSETGDFAVVVCAENLQRAAQSVGESYPSSAIEITFPIEPEQFFTGEPHHGERVDLEVEEVSQPREGPVVITE
jgi:hypothetical protein